jgi:hypothetical protein
MALTDRNARLYSLVTYVFFMFFCVFILFKSATDGLSSSLPLTVVAGLFTAMAFVGLVLEAYLMAEDEEKL